MVLLQRKLYFSKDPEGVKHFTGRGGGGGSSFFRGGVQMLISIEPHITCDFSGGSGPPIPPLDPHINRGVVKTDRNRSLNTRTDIHAYARRIIDNEHFFVSCFNKQKFVNY